MNDFSHNIRKLEVAVLRIVRVLTKKRGQNNVTTAKTG